MPHMHTLEGPAYKAYLLLRRQMMVEAARINNMDFQTAWGIPRAPDMGAVTYENLLPGPDASLKLIDLTPEHLGITQDATTEQGYLFNLATEGENTNQVNTTISNGRVAGIYGVHVLGEYDVPSTVQEGGNPMTRLLQIDVNIGGREARVWPMRPIYDSPSKELYFLDPVLVTEAKTLTIDMWVATSDASVRLSFIGLYAEPKE